MDFIDGEAECEDDPNDEIEELPEADAEDDAFINDDEEEEGYSQYYDIADAGEDVTETEIEIQPDDETDVFIPPTLTPRYEHLLNAVLLQHGDTQNIRKNFFLASESLFGFSDTEILKGNGLPPEAREQTSQIGLQYLLDNFPYPLLRVYGIKFWPFAEICNTNRASQRNEDAYTYATAVTERSGKYVMYVVGIQDFLRHCFEINNFIVSNVAIFACVVIGILQGNFAILCMNTKSLRFRILPENVGLKQLKVVQYVEAFTLLEGKSACFGDWDTTVLATKPLKHFWREFAMQNGLKSPSEIAGRIQKLKGINPSLAKHHDILWQTQGSIVSFLQEGKKFFFNLVLDRN